MFLLMIFSLPSLLIWKNFNNLMIAITVTLTKIVATNKVSFVENPNFLTEQQKPTKFSMNK